jgi:DegV family protein with EDD domain
VERLRKGERATTSQPAPASFLEGYRRAAQDGELVLGMIVSSTLSGTFQSAEAAARQTDLPVRLFDTKGAALTQGLLALYAAELTEAGRGIDEIIAELTRVRGQSGTLFTVEVFDNLLASGRVGRGKVMIAGLLDIKPILLLGQDGRVGPLANVRGSKNVVGRMLDIVKRMVPARAKRLRFGIQHVGRPEIVAEITQGLNAIFGEREILESLVTPVIATHLGPGAWGLTWQAEGIGNNPPAPTATRWRRMSYHCIRLSFCSHR